MGLHLKRDYPSRDALQNKSGCLIGLALMPCPAKQEALFKSINRD